MPDTPRPETRSSRSGPSSRRTPMSISRHRGITNAPPEIPMGLG